MRMTSRRYSRSSRNRRRPGLGPQVAIGRGHDAHVDAARHVLADAPQLAFLNHAQHLRLRARRARRSRRETACRRAPPRRRPGARRPRPVNAPRACPNSSASTRSSGSAAQFSVQNARSRRGPQRCSARATSSLPLPLSPSISTANGAAGGALDRPPHLRHRVARPAQLGDIGRRHARRVAPPPPRRPAPRRWPRSSSSGAGSATDRGSTRASTATPGRRPRRRRTAPARRPPSDPRADAARSRCPRSWPVRRPRVRCVRLPMPPSPRTSRSRRRTRPPRRGAAGAPACRPRRAGRFPLPRSGRRGGSPRSRRRPDRPRRPFGRHARPAGKQRERGQARRRDVACDDFADWRGRGQEILQQRAARADDRRHARTAEGAKPLKVCARR